MVNRAQVAPCRIKLRTDRADISCQILVGLARDDVGIEYRSRDHSLRGKLHRDACRVSSQTENGGGPSLAQYALEQVLRLAPAFEKVEQPTDAAFGGNNRLLDELKARGLKNRTIDLAFCAEEYDAGAGK